MPGCSGSARASSRRVQRPARAQRRNWRATVSGLLNSGGSARQGASDALALHGGFARILATPDYAIGWTRDIVEWFADLTEKGWGAVLEGGTPLLGRIAAGRGLEAGAALPIRSRITAITAAGTKASQRRRVRSL